MTQPMRGAQTSAGSNGRRSRLHRYFRRAAYVLVLLLLIGWEVQDGKVYQSDNCDLTTAPPNENLIEAFMMTRAYGWVLNIAHLKNSDKVAEIGIESTLQQVPDNVCAAREFTAELLNALKGKGAKVIALDKFYGETSCPSNDPGTLELLKAIRSTNVPVVVGSATDDSQKPNTSSCLVLSTELFTPLQNDSPNKEFSMARAWLSADESHVESTTNASDNSPPSPGDKEVLVYTGLTRLNENLLKIPVNWPVYPDAASTADNKYTTGPLSYSFPLTAAQRFDPKIVSDTTLLSSERQPYANVKDPVEHEDASTVLCSASSTDITKVTKRWGIDCPKPARQPLDLTGKVVVIGSDSWNDRPEVPGGKMYGYDLQAHYIAALLGGAYLRDFSPWWVFISLLVYYGVAEGLLPYLSYREHPVLGLPHIKTALYWEIGVFCLAMLVGFFLPLALHRFPPLGVLLIVAAVFVPRLLIELWAFFNERMDEAEKEKELSS